MSQPRAISYGHACKNLWHLRPKDIFLNHGSYGATPKPVLAAQTRWRRRMETQPVRFLVETLPQELSKARHILAGFVNADPADLVFIDNATTGMNAVIQSLCARRRVRRVLVTNHGYRAVALALQHTSSLWDGRIEIVDLPLPLHAEDIVDNISQGLKAKEPDLLILDHITSPTAAVLPVKEICAHARALGVTTLIDGAHAPGQVPLNLRALGADYYVANLHKWLFTPRGCGFLWAAPDKQHYLHPTVISHGYDPGGFQHEFDWTGTKDPTPILCLPDALEFFAMLGGADLMKRNRALAQEAALHISQAWKTRLAAPASLRGSMATIALPGRYPGIDATGADRWSAHLWQRHRIEIPAFVFDKHLWVRISAQAYNEMSDYEALARVVARELPQ